MDFFFLHLRSCCCSFIYTKWLEGTRGLLNEVFPKDGTNLDKHISELGWMLAVVSKPPPLVVSWQQVTARLMISSLLISLSPAPIWTWKFDWISQAVDVEIRSYISKYTNREGSES